MTKKNCNEILTTLNKQMQIKKRKIMMFLDKQNIEKLEVFASQSGDHKLFDQVFDLKLKFMRNTSQNIKKKQLLMDKFPINSAASR